MASSDFIVGLEIGTSKVCAVVGETKPDGTIHILGVGQAPSRGVRKGEIVDFETASKCVREALVDAEEKSDVMIGSVYLAITGGHIECFNNRGAVNLPEDRDEICEEDFEDVQASAREVSIPSPNMFVHSILQHYYVDGQDGVLNPIGMLGRKLEADFHIIHGVRHADQKQRALREGSRPRSARRGLQPAGHRAGGARSESENARRARHRHGRRHDGLRGVCGRRGEAERLPGRSAAITSPTTSRSACAFRWRRRRG